MRKGSLNKSALMM